MPRNRSILEEKNGQKSTDFEEKMIKSAAKASDLGEEKMVKNGGEIDRFRGQMIKSAAKSTDFEEEKW